MSPRPATYNKCVAGRQHITISMRLPISPRVTGMHLGLSGLTEARAWKATWQQKSSTSLFTICPTSEHIKFCRNHKTYGCCLLLKQHPSPTSSTSQAKEEDDDKTSFQPASRTLLFCCYVAFHPRATVRPFSCPQWRVCPVTSC